MFWKSHSRKKDQRRQHIDEILGDYQRTPVENGWHQGSIEAVPGSQHRLRWRNNAGITWILRLATDKEILKTDQSCPYFQSGGTEFIVERRGGKVVGFRFNGELYVRDGAVINQQRSGGFHGYISMTIQSPPNGFGYGASFYVSIWPLIREPMNGFQIGLPSTWIIPDNRNFEKALCPHGTVARDTMKERGPYYRDVFQTIEGGLGYWASTRFPSTTPKYRINGTPNGYNREISSPGWGFGKTQSLQPEQMGIAQLSNRLLIPPDGITFEDGANGVILGNAWMVLDLIPERSDVDRTPTGDQCWTLFLNSKNFKGPVAFWIPETWSQLSQTCSDIQCRGLDARPGLMGGGAMEVNTVPYFESKSNNGAVFSRIPPIQFLVDQNGETVLMQDVAFYTKDAVRPSGDFDPTKSWKPRLHANPISFHQGPSRVKMVDVDKIVQTKIIEKGKTQAFGLEWKQAKAGEGFMRLPQYFREGCNCRSAIKVTDVPDDTALATESFDTYTCPQTYVSPNSGVWSNPGPKSKPYRATLTDGSVVTYAWYRFVDQPSIQSLGWPKTKLGRVQERVEKIHSTFRINKEYLPPPSSGTLVNVDNAIIVDPPKGFEVGFVPIAIRQENGTRRD